MKQVYCFNIWLNTLVALSLKWKHITQIYSIEINFTGRWKPPEIVSLTVHSVWEIVWSKFTLDLCLRVKMFQHLFQWCIFQFLMASFSAFLYGHGFHIQFCNKRICLLEIFLAVNLGSSIFLEICIDNHWQQK